MSKMQRSAVFSTCKRYRYTLDRSWGADSTMKVLYIGLNPSTADECTGDTTTTTNLKRLATLANGHMNRYRAVNLFAIRSSTTGILGQVDDPIGPDNDVWLIRSIQWADVIFAGWGNGGRRLHRSRTVAVMLRDAQCPIYCLGITKIGEPRHPCRLSYDERFYALREDCGEWYTTAAPRRLSRPAPG